MIGICGESCRKWGERYAKNVLSGISHHFWCDPDTRYDAKLRKLTQRQVYFLKWWKKSIK